jgi:hypothetical protein
MISCRLLNRQTATGQSLFLGLGDQLPLHPGMAVRQEHSNVGYQLLEGRVQRRRQVSYYLKRELLSLEVVPEEVVDSVVCECLEIVAMKHIPPIIHSNATKSKTRIEITSKLDRARRRLWPKSTLISPAQNI